MVAVPRATSSGRFVPPPAKPSRIRIPDGVERTGSTSWSTLRPGSRATERVYAIMDNLSSHRTTDVLLFVLAHPRWEMVFQPKYAAYLNLIEPWWKILCSLALAGRRFETWDEITDTIHRSTVYWNAHRHPFVWGKHRRHRPRRSPGIALLPRAA